MTCAEDELLIGCARVLLTPDIRERLEQLVVGKIDWQVVLDRSWWHRIRPLTFYHLSNLESGKVPHAVLQALEENTIELRERNENLVKMLRIVAELFEDNGIRMLVFKGPTLAKEAYGDIGLRECGDLDMLIRVEDFPRAKKKLTQEGFACLWDEVDNQRDQQVFACEFRRDGVELDIHWDLAPSWLNYRVDFERLWTGGRPFEPDCRYARKLSPEDCVSVLSMHGTRHWWDRLRWICDIRELVHCGSIADWNRLKETAIAGRCLCSVRLGLCLASDLLDADLPEDVQDWLSQWPVAKQLTAQVGVWLGNAEHAADSRKLTERFMFRMRVCDRMRDRLPQLVRYLLAVRSRRLNWSQ